MNEVSVTVPPLRISVLALKASTQMINWPTFYADYKAGDNVMRRLLASLIATFSFPLAAVAQTCPYDPRCINNPYGAGNPYSPNSVTNPYGQYGSPYSNQSANNPYATNAPKLYDQNGNYKGRLSSNPYDADSISNPYGRYGSPYSPVSPNNPYGAGNGFGPPLIVVPQSRPKGY